ncbi:GIY-YIG nuclease family protein [Jeotgalibacillus aurantiacus]|uniref:GIY-YIG nuclease family protein n=1 Tax=Jeotgalibacillus aurantiacus TaxID=2763266 RepID=UPI001D0BC44A|nr:GIY-YIG nuclease family protein [Jeotgalibacillus aurantiacus]
MNCNSSPLGVPGELLNGFSELKLSDFDRPGVYGLILNETEYLYIGKSNTSMFKRIWDHIGNLLTKPELFGLLPSELKCRNMRISIVEVKDFGDDKISLNDKELNAINKNKPILQIQPNSDRCIRGNDKRRAAVKERMHIV